MLSIGTQPNFALLVVLVVVAETSCSCIIASGAISASTAKTYQHL